jgi:hypothetical protein
MKLYIGFILIYGINCLKYNINVTKEKEEFLWKLIGQLFQSSYLYYLL